MASPPFAFSAISEHQDRAKLGNPVRATSLSCNFAKARELPKIKWQASVGMVSVLTNPHSGHVSVDSSWTGDMEVMTHNLAYLTASRERVKVIMELGRISSYGETPLKRLNIPVTPIGR